MAGTIALVGAGEFLDGMADVDRHLMAQAPTQPPLVVVMPTAAGQEHDVRKWPDMGVRHFRKLGAQVESALVLDRAGADNPAHADLIRRSDFVYMSGGSPGYLLQSLRGTKVWAAMLEVYRRGGIIAGCSAGAMVLGSATRVRRGGRPGVWTADWDWDTGLGLVPGVIVAPHFDRMTPERLRALLDRVPTDHVILGIDEHTAVIGDGRDWTVMGQGTVSLFAGPERARLQPGDRITLPAVKSAAT